MATRDPRKPSGVYLQANIVVERTRYGVIPPARIKRASVGRARRQGANRREATFERDRSTGNDFLRPPGRGALMRRGRKAMAVYARMPSTAQRIGYAPLPGRSMRRRVVRGWRPGNRATAQRPTGWPSTALIVPASAPRSARNWVEGRGVITAAVSARPRRCERFHRRALYSLARKAS